MSDIRILVDIGNSREILVAFLTIFHSKPEWTIDSNAFVNNVIWSKYPNETARYFCIDIEAMRFFWSTHDADSNARGSYQSIATVEDAISIAEFAISNADTFKCDPLKPFFPVYTQDNTPEPLNEDNISYVNVDKLKQYINMDSVISFKKKTKSLYEECVEYYDMYQDVIFKTYSKHAKDIMARVKSKLKESSEAPKKQ
jgi:hypothetical protein